MYRNEREVFLGLKLVERNLSAVLGDGRGAWMNVDQELDIIIV